MIPQSRRVKRFMVNADVVLDMVLRGMGAYTPGYVYVLDRAPFPPDAKLVGVNYEWPYQAFGFLVEHESFEEVPDGGMAPNVAESWDAMYRAVRVVEEGADAPLVAGAA